MTSDLRALTRKNHSYIVISPCWLRFTDEEAHPLKSGDIIWFSNEANNNAYFYLMDGRVGYLYGSVRDSSNVYIVMTDEWIDPKSIVDDGEPGLVTHGDALERLKL